VLSKRDYSAFEKLNLDRKPVGVRFSPLIPDGIERLDKELNFCEMFGEAQNGQPFYVGKEDFHCIEPMLLGMEEPEPIFVSGLYGEELNVFKGPGPCRKMYQYLPRMLKGSVNYVAFSSVDRLSFDPDIVIIVADLARSRALLRAVPYSTGDPIVSRTTHVATCSWIYVYPVLSGVINYIITGLGAGMEAARPLPPGLFVISVPSNLISTMLENLPEMEIATAPSLSGSDMLRKHFKETGERLRQKIDRR
jgi:uncharacterized protein (DUF169 family)